MSQQNDGIDITVTIDEDTSAKQYYCVVGDDADRRVKIAGTQGAAIVGILQDAVDGSSEEQATTIRVAGSTKVVAGDTNISYGTSLTVDGSGMADVAASGDYIWGMALEACGSSGDIIQAVIMPAGQMN